MIQTRTRMLTTIAGIFTALVIILSQLFAFQAFPENISQEKHARKKEVEDARKSSDQVYFSLPSIQIPSSIHFELNQEVVLIFEIVTDKVRSVADTGSVYLLSNKLFKTLFRVIISPNAP